MTDVGCASPVSPASPATRREFVRAGVLASTTVVGACASPRMMSAAPAPRPPAPRPSGDWDLSWIDRVAAATDRAVFDWPSLGDVTEPMTMEIAARYLDNCQAAYTAGTYDARVVMNIRTVAIAAAMRDDAWARYKLGDEYTVKDPSTNAPAVRNPFWSRGPGVKALPGVPTLEELVQRGAIILVCDFALGHLSKRLASKFGRTEAEVHNDLRGLFVPSAYAVPSGMFGLARAQNAGCAYMHV